MQQITFSLLSMYLKQGSNYGPTLPNYSVIGEEKAATAEGRKTMFSTRLHILYGPG